MLHARHHVQILAGSPASSCVACSHWPSKKMSPHSPSQSSPSSNREPHAPICTHSHLRSPPVVCPHTPSTRACLLALACGLPIVALHCMAGHLFSHLLARRAEHKYITSGALRDLLLFFLQQDRQFQELFLSYAFFCSSFLFPRAWCSLFILSHSNNPTHPIALSVAGRHSIKRQKIQQYATNQLFLPNKFSNPQ